MVTLLLGPHGYGKSTYIIDRIKDDYKQKINSFLIVPEQQTVVSERILTQLLPPSAQLYTEATNFTRLANSVFRKTGGLKYNYITKSNKNLLMYRALCEVRPLLKQYNIPKGREKSSVKLFLQAIGELKSYGVDFARLEESLTLLQSVDLQARIQDMLTVWACYDRLLKERYDDPYDDLLMLDKKLGEFNFFEGCNVYIDSFYGFTKSQLAIVKKIISGAKNVTIALDCPQFATPETMQYMKIAGTKSKLISICKSLKTELCTVIFDTDYKHKSAEIAYACKSLWDFSAEPIPYTGDITLALADDEFSECEYVCSKIKELILKGEQYGKIGIITRNSSTYQGIINYCLEKYSIPHYISTPSKITAQPIIKMVFSALKAVGGMRAEDVISYAKCGYTDIDPADLCLLESYVYKWSIYGKKFKDDDYWNANPDGFSKSITEAQVNELDRIQAARSYILKKLAILEKPFMLGLNAKECATAVYEFLNAHEIKKRLNEEIKTESRENAQELSQVWGALMSGLDSVCEICGDVICDSETFLSLLSYAVMDTKIGTIPTGEDNVTVADASLVRARGLKHVFILGANEGSFPAVVKDSSFFSDRDKVELETVEIDLSARTDERSDDELLFFKNSISAASHTVTVTALKTNIKGEKAEESIGFTRLKALLEGIKPVDISALNAIDRIYTPQTARELYGSCAPSLKEAITNVLQAEPPCPEFENINASVGEETAQRIFGKRLYLSKSRLESFVKCKFNYYCTYVLGLRDNEKISFTHNDIGTLVHDIFEHFLKQQKEDARDYTDGEIEEIVTRLTDEYTSCVCGARALSNKMKHLFARLKSTVCVFVRALLSEMKESKFTPEYFELTINGDGCSAPPPTVFPITEECSAVMTGIADRVDVYRDENKTYIRIVDYKTGNYTFKPSKLQNGLDMQMLIYLFALCNMDECKFKSDLLKWTSSTEPGGIVYLSYKIDKTDFDKEIDLTSPLAQQNEADSVNSKISRSGRELSDFILDENGKEFNLSDKSYITADDFTQMFSLVKSSITKIGIDMLSGDASALPLAEATPCSYCKNGAICRRRDRSERFN